MKALLRVATLTIVLTLAALPAPAAGLLDGGSLLGQTVTLNPVFTANGLTASIQLPGGLTAQLSLTFEQVVGLNPGALSITAQVVNPLSLLTRLPGPLVTLPVAFPVLVRIQPTPGSGLSFSGVYDISLYTTVLTYASPLRLYRGPNGGQLSDMTGSLEMGSVRAGGSGPGFSDFVIVLDLRPVDPVIVEKLSDLESALEENAASIAPLVYADLTDRVEAIRTAYESGATQLAVDETTAFAAAVKAQSGAAIPDVWQAGNPGLVNVAGTLRSLASTLRFSLVVKLN